MGYKCTRRAALIDPDLHYLLVDREELLKTLDEQRSKFTDERVSKNFSKWNKTM